MNYNLIPVIIVEILIIRVLVHLCRNNRDMDSIGSSLMIFVLAVLFFCGDIIYLA